MGSVVGSVARSVVRSVARNVAHSVVGMVRSVEDIQVCILHILVGKDMVVGKDMAHILKDIAIRRMDYRSNPTIFRNLPN